MLLYKKSNKAPGPCLAVFQSSAIEKLFWLLTGGATKGGSRIFTRSIGTDGQRLQKPISHPWTNDSGDQKRAPFGSRRVCRGTVLIVAGVKGSTEPTTDSSRHRWYIDFFACSFFFFLSFLFFTFWGLFCGLPMARPHHRSYYVVSFASVKDGF